MPPPKPDSIQKHGLYFLLSLALALALTFLIQEPTFTDSQSYVLFLLLFAMALCKGILPHRARTERLLYHA